MIYDIIIIGGGPAGITAGIYTARQKLNALIITKNFGGQMTRKTVDIENYTGFGKISGFDLIKKFEDHLKSTDIGIEMNEVIEVEKNDDIFSVKTKDDKEFKSKTVIVATGGEPRMLNVVGEEQFMGRGISYCALCDGPIYRDKTVAVVGGGEAGFETALFLSNYVKKIYILEYGSEIKASKEAQEAIEGKAEVITNVEIKEIKGDKFVNSLVYNNGETIDVNGIFVEIGYQPVVFFVRNLVDINSNGEIEVDPYNFSTKTKGLFAAGDVEGGKCKQIIVAAGDGAVAATSAYKYVKQMK